MVVVPYNTYKEESHHLARQLSALNIERHVTELVMLKVHGEKVPYGDNISRVKAMQDKAKEPLLWDHQFEVHGRHQQAQKSCSDHKIPFAELKIQLLGFNMALFLTARLALYLEPLLY